MIAISTSWHQNYHTDAIRRRPNGQRRNVSSSSPPETCRRSTQVTIELEAE